MGQHQATQTLFLIFSSISSKVHLLCCGYVVVWMV